MTAGVLKVDQVSRRFGGVTAVNGLTFEAAHGVTGLIGPNGAGKSTVFNLITGLVRPDEGSIKLDGRDLTGMRPDKIARAGVRRTFQNIRLFADQSALDNVAVGALTTATRTSMRAARRVAARILDELGLAAHAALRPSEMPYATQRQVEIARCLAADPQVLLLDEPAAGMHATEREDLVTLVQDLARRGLTIIIVEHDVGLVSAVSEQVVVMDFGVKIAQGAADEIRQDPRVVTAYLGTADHV